jgi:PAS domain-containing protein
MSWKLALILLYNNARVWRRITEMVHREDEKNIMHELAGILKSIHRKAADHKNSEFESKPTADALSIVYDAIDSTVGGVIIADAQGNITYVNPSFLRMFGYADKSEVLGMNAALLWSMNRRTSSRNCRIH